MASIETSIESASARLEFPGQLPEQLHAWQSQPHNGLTLRGQRSQPKGRSLVHFLHGNGFCGLSYWPMLEKLVVEYDLFIHDIQGHGDSDVGDCFLGWNENAVLVQKVWTEFSSDYQNGDLIGIGHSLGGVITALMAAEHPSMFSRLILLDPVIFTPKMLLGMQLFKFLRLKNPNPLAKKAQRRRNGWSSRQEAFSDFVGRGIFKGWHDAALQAHVEFALCEQADELVALKCPPQREAEIFSTFPRKLWTALSGITVPVHIIYGKDTYPFVKDAVALLQKRNHRVSSEELPGGHCFMQEYPDLAASAILSSLSTNGAG